MQSGLEPSTARRAFVPGTELTLNLQPWRTLDSELEVQGCSVSEGCRGGGLRRGGAGPGVPDAAQFKDESVLLTFHSTSNELLFQDINHKGVQNTL